MKYDEDLIKKLSDEFNKHTEIAKEYAKIKNIKYSDTIRRKVSYFNNGQKIVSEEKKQRTSPAKILVYDIETAPLLAYVWRLWKQNVNHKNGMLQSRSWFMLTWSAKWLFEDKVMCGKLTGEEALKQDDKRIVKSLWDLFNEADIIVAHNGRKFDNRQMNARFLFHQIPPPTPYQTIDTLQHSKKKFDIPSHSLEFIGNFMGLGGKIDTGGFSLWEKCMKGEQSALDEMEKYNIKDVLLLEEVYLRLRPFINPHPNIGLFIKENVQSCPSCGSEYLDWNGTYSTYANSFDSFRCKSCGSIGRSRNTSLDKDARRFLTMSVPS